MEGRHLHKVSQPFRCFLHLPSQVQARCSHNLPGASTAMNKRSEIMHAKYVRDGHGPAHEKQ